MIRKMLLALLVTMLLPAAAQAENSYIVVFDENASLQKEVVQLRSDNQEVPKVFRNVFQGAQVLLSPQEKQELSQDPAVQYIERDGLAHATRATSLWGLDRIDQRGLPLNSSFLVSQTGRGVQAYVVDTGLRADHQEFQGRVLQGYSAISDGRGTGDCDGHGTHVAGTVAGTTYGVAPGAQVVPVRVLDCEGSGSWSGIIAALDWIVAQHDPGELAVANMSLGGGRMNSVNEAVERLVSDGVPVAVAAGNENADACATSPASASGALTVGATTSSDTRSSFSNWGPCVDVFAPGSSILSAWNSSSTASATLSGTSMASPHAAGVLSLLLESGRAERDLLALASPDLLSGLPATTANRLVYFGDSAPLPPLPPLANDHFANAELILDSATNNNSRATKETGEPTHVHSLTGSRNSLWYKWVAPRSGVVTFSTAGSSFDTLLAVYRGEALSQLVVQAANDDYGVGYTSQVSFAVQSGQTYKIAVDGYGGSTGNVVLQATFVGRAANIISGPKQIAPSNSAEFVFEGDQCSLDGSPFTSCSSPFSLHNLGDGEHTFGVRYGQGEAVVYRWNVDTVAPEALTINLQGRLASWSGEAGATFFCSEDGLDIEECSSPRQIRGSSLRVWQEDLAGNRSLPGEVFIDVPDEPLAAPSVTKKPKPKTKSRKALFRFQGVAGATFECRLGTKSWVTCSSPKVFENLRPGQQRFSVRQSLGDMVSVAVSYSWFIQPTKSPGKPSRKP